MYTRNIIFLFALIMSVGYIEAKRKGSKVLPAAILDPVRDAAVKCIAETNFGNDILKSKAKPSQFTEGDNLKSILFCCLVKSGLGYETGHVNVEETAKHFPNNVQDVIVECDKTEGESPVDTILKFVQCFEEKSPILYTLLPIF